MSEPSTLSPELKRFLDEQIHTIDELLTLLFLRGDRKRPWKVDDVVVELRGSHERAAAALESLVAKKLLSFSFEMDQGLKERTRNYSYTPIPKDVDALVEELEGTFASARIEVLMFIASNAVARVRAQALQTFSMAIRGSRRTGGDDG